MSNQKRLSLGSGSIPFDGQRTSKNLFFLVCMASSLFVVFKLEYCRRDILLANVCALSWLDSEYQYAVFWQLFGFALLFGTTVEFMMGAL
jgi:hypothetical protein